MKTNILREIRGIGSDVGRSLRGAWSSTKRGWKLSRSTVPFRRGQLTGNRLYWRSPSNAREASLRVGLPFRMGWKARRTTNPFIGSSVVEGVKLGRGGWQRKKAFIRSNPEEGVAHKFIRFVRQGKKSTHEYNAPASLGLRAGHFSGRYPLAAGTMGAGVAASGGLVANRYLIRPARQIVSSMREERPPTAEEVMMSPNVSEYELMEPYLRRSQKTGGLKKIRLAHRLGGVYMNRPDVERRKRRRVRRIRSRRRRRPISKRPSLYYGPRISGRVGSRTAGYRTRPEEIEEHEGGLKTGRAYYGLGRRLIVDEYGKLKEMITSQGKDLSPHKQRFKNLTEDFEGTAEMTDSKYKNQRPIDPNDDSISDGEKKKLIAERNRSNKIKEEVTEKLDKSTQIAASRLIKSIRVSKEAQKVLMEIAREGSLPAAIALSAVGMLYLGNRFRRKRSTTERLSELRTEDIPTTTTGLMPMPRVKYPNRFRNRMAVSPGFGTLRDANVLPADALYLSSKTRNLKKRFINPYHKVGPTRVNYKNGHSLRKKMKFQLGNGRSKVINWKTWSNTSKDAKAYHLVNGIKNKLSHHKGSTRIALKNIKTLDGTSSTKQRVEFKRGIKAISRYRTLRHRGKKITNRYGYMGLAQRTGNVKKWGGGIARVASKIGRHAAKLAPKSMPSFKRGLVHFRRKAAAVPGFYHGIRGDRAKWVAGIKGKPPESGMFARKQTMRGLKLARGTKKHRAYSWGEKMGERVRSFDRGFKGTAKDKVDRARSRSRSAGEKFARRGGPAKLAYKVGRFGATDPIGAGYTAMLAGGMATAFGLRRRKRGQIRQGQYVDQMTY